LTPTWAKVLREHPDGIAFDRLLELISAEGVFKRRGRRRHPPFLLTIKRLKNDGFVKVFPSAAIDSKGAFYWTDLDPKRYKNSERSKIREAFEELMPRIVIKPNLRRISQEVSSS